MPKPHKLPSGNWRIQVSIDGKRVSYTGRTAKECNAWAAQITGQVEAGLTYESHKTLLSDFLDRWMENKKTKLQPATVQQYGVMIRVYILPKLGKFKLKDLSPAKIQAAYDEMLADGVGARTVEVTHAVLHGCLEHAFRLGLLGRNPAGAVIVPKPEAREMQIWTESQVSHFLASVEGQRNEMLYRLAAATGMRRGELLGLKWEDVDWAGETLRIVRQAFEPDGGGFIFKAPKSRRGRRNIELGAGLVERLREQIDIVSALRVLARSRWQENDLVFPSTVGTPQTGDTIIKEFHRLVQRAGLPRIRFHDLRHSAASIMLMHNIPPAAVAYVLGDSLQVLLSTYAHYIPGNQSEIASLMDEVTTTIRIEELV